MSIVYIGLMLYLDFPTNNPNTLYIMIDLINTTWIMRGMPILLTYSSLKSTHPTIEQEFINKVNLNQCISMHLVHPINADNWTNHVPPSISPLIQ